MNRWSLPRPGSFAGLVPVLVAGVMLAGCGGSSGPTASPTPTPSAPPTSSPSPSPTPFVHEGAPITAAEATATLPVVLDDSNRWTPVGAYGDQIIVTSSAKSLPETEPYQYALWDTTTGVITPGWTGEAAMQDIFAGSDGDWIATVRANFVAYGEGALIVRDLKTGEVRQLTDAHTQAYGYGSWVWNGLVVWTDGVTEAGTQGRVQMYDTATEATTTIATTDEADERVRSSVIGGGKVAWLYVEGTKFQIIVRDLATEAERTIDIDSEPISIDIPPDGDTIGWDSVAGQGSLDKHILNLTTNDEHVVGKAQGGGIFVTNRYASWDTASGPSGGQLPAGLYDMQTHELRTLASTTGTQTNVAHVMGKWYVWQELLLSGEQPGSAGNYLRDSPA